MPNRPPSPARLLSFDTGQPIDDATVHQSLGLLSLLAGRAMVAGADPAAAVSPDHNLLLLCDHVVIAKRQHDQFEGAWRALERPHHPDEKRLYDEWRRADRTVRSLLAKIRKLPATTPAGLFAKAAAVSRTGSAAAIVAVSLAHDLLASAELRRAVWPAGSPDG
jgi:hypothetical protein